MYITFAGYEFDASYPMGEGLKDRAGVYVIVKSEGDEYKVIDVGESHAVKSRVANHERRDCWEKYCKDDIWICAVYYTPHLKQPGRKEIEQKIREMYNPPCGEQ